MTITPDSHQWVQLSNRQRMSPFPNYLSMEAICTVAPKLYDGIGYQQVILGFHRNDEMGVFVDQADYDRVADEFLKLLDRDETLFARMRPEIDEHGKSFLAWCQTLNRTELQSLDDAALAAEFSMYAQYYQQIYPRYFGIIFVEKRLTEVLRQILTERHLADDEASAAFATLTREPEAMVNAHEELARLELVGTIATNEHWQALFEQPTNRVLAQLDDSEYAPLAERLREHEMNFWWITRDYEDPILTLADIVDRIQKNLAQGDVSQLAAKRALIHDHPQEVEELEEQLNLSATEQRQFRQMREGMYLKEQRKRIVSQSLAYFDAVLEEVARRADLTMKLVRFLKVDEVPAALNRTLTRSELEERYERSFWIASESKPTQVIQGRASDPWQAKLYAIDESVTELKGLGISGGVATGKARLMLHPNEAETVQPGEIIVTMQAVPSFSAAISRAAGIIADGGTGLTSHTATLAREAKIPGVSGLKIATKVIKSGDTIEVDGNKGIVKILTRA